MDALIGHTGLVGGTLLRQRSFERCFHRANLHTLAGQRFELLVISALPAEKWRANAQPAQDLANMQRLLQALDGVIAERVALVSTIDVYACPIGVTEDDDPGQASPYGAHRLAFERALRQRWPGMTVLRLPGLFGPGLKKNALHDLLHNHEVERLHPDGVLQWYPLQRLWQDLSTALDAGLPLANAAVAPLRTGDIAARLFARLPWPAPQSVTAPHYDMRSRHAGQFGGSNGLWLDEAAVWSALGGWLAQERLTKCPSLAAPEVH